MYTEMISSDLPGYRPRKSLFDVVTHECPFRTGCDCRKVFLMQPEPADQCQRGNLKQLPRST